MRLPECRSALLAATLMAGLLSLTEVPATQLVRPPGVRSVAITLFNEIHNGRSDQLIAMTLCLIVCVGVVVTAAQWLTRKIQRRGAQAQSRG